MNTRETMSGSSHLTETRRRAGDPSLARSGEVVCPFSSHPILTLMDIKCHILLTSRRLSSLRMNRTHCFCDKLRPPFGQRWDKCQVCEFLAECQSSKPNEGDHEPKWRPGPALAPRRLTHLSFFNWILVLIHQAIVFPWLAETHTEDASPLFLGEHCQHVSRESSFPERLKNVRVSQNLSCSYGELLEIASCGETPGKPVVITHPTNFQLRD